MSSSEGDESVFLIVVGKAIFLYGDPATTIEQEKDRIFRFFQRYYAFPGMKRDIHAALGRDTITLQENYQKIKVLLEGLESLIRKKLEVKAFRTTAAGTV